jgi:hypothetical protein
MMNAAHTTPSRPAPDVPLPVSIEPFAAVSPDDDAVLAMLIEGSLDPEVLRKNYLPRPLDRERARAYLAATEGVVLRIGGEAVGVAAALPDPSPGEGVTVPAGSVELDMWVLPRVRGQGPRWFTPVLAWIAERHDTLVGVTWADNHVAVAMLLWSGWRQVGRSHWRDDTMAGDCLVFQLDLAAWRARRGGAR